MTTPICSTCCCLSARDAVDFVSGTTYADFKASRLRQNAVLKSVEIIGEAASRVSADTRETLGHIPWGEIVGMRNRIVHAYFETDIEIVWRVVQEDLPNLSGSCLPNRVMNRRKIENAAGFPPGCNEERVERVLRHYGVAKRGRGCCRRRGSLRGLHSDDNGSPQGTGVRSTSVDCGPRPIALGYRMVTIDQIAALAGPANPRRWNSRRRPGCAARDRERCARYTE